MEFFRPKKEELFKENMAPGELLDQIIANFPYRSGAVEVLAGNLKHLSSPTAERIRTLYDLEVFADKDVCSRRYARRHYSTKKVVSWHSTWVPESGIEWSHMYTMDKAVFVIIHPEKKGQRFVSVGNHKFTTHTTDRGPTLIIDEPALFFWGNSFYVNFRLSTGYDESLKLKDVPGLRFFEEVGVEKLRDDLGIVFAEQMTSRGEVPSSSFADVYIPLKDMGKNWYIFAIRNVEERKRKRIRKLG